MSKKPHKSRLRRIIIFLVIAFVLIEIFVYFNEKGKTNSQNQADQSPQNQPASFGVPVDIVKAIDNAKTIEQVKNVIQPSLSKYGLTLYINESPVSHLYPKVTTLTSLTENDLEDVKNYALLFYYEWHKYPVNWVTRSKLIGVLFVKRIQFKNGYYKSTENSLEDLAAMWDIKHNYMVYTIGPSGNYNNDFLRETLHHEYFHYQIFEHFGNMTYEFPQWIACNDKNFSYKGRGDLAVEDPNFQYIDHNTPGFVDSYAPYALEEDMAETYGYIMTDQLYKKLLTWLPEDSILNCKATFLKTLIHQMDPEIDEGYFGKIHQQ